jgi:hypothetical protein
MMLVKMLTEYDESKSGGKLYWHKGDILRVLRAGERCITVILADDSRMDVSPGVTSQELSGGNWIPKRG